MPFFPLKGREDRDAGPCPCLAALAPLPRGQLCGQERQPAPRSQGSPVAASAPPGSPLPSAQAPVPAHCEGSGAGRVGGSWLSFLV